MSEKQNMIPPEYENVCDQPEIDYYTSEGVEIILRFLKK